MTTKQVWFITGAGRGMGVDIATGRNAAAALGRRRRRRGHKATTLLAQAHAYRELSSSLAYEEA